MAGFAARFIQAGSISVGRLIVISNRAPSVDGSGDSGGLVVALKDALAQNGGLWIGCVPERTDSPSEALAMHHRPDFSIGLFELEPQLYRDYYLGYSNSVLWPALHGRVDLIDVKPRYAAAYREVARRIAGLVADTVRDDDRIWVHDYQRCCHVWMAPVWQYDFRRCLSFAGRVQSCLRPVFAAPNDRWP